MISWSFSIQKIMFAILNPIYRLSLSQPWQSAVLDKELIAFTISFNITFLFQDSFTPPLLNSSFYFFYPLPLQQFPFSQRFLYRFTSNPFPFPFISLPQIYFNLLPPLSLPLSLCFLRLPLSFPFLLPLSLFPIPYPIYLLLP